MNTRYSSPPARSGSPPRPATHRKRSNSLPIVEALGCSTPEAELILAESRAVVRRRHASERPPRRRKSHHHHHHERAYRPQDHMHHLSGDTAVVDEALDTSTVEDFRPSHNRIVSSTSNRTDGSASTIKGSIGTAQPLLPSPPPSPSASPLGDYSANLAKFIQSQLNSIPTYHTQAVNSPHSCPDLSLKQSPPQSPIRLSRRPVDMPNVVMPPIRPPLKSAFSEWSSAGDSENEADQVPPLPSVLRNTKSYTPSILNYYENSSFLLSSTPLDSSDDNAITAGIPRNSKPPTSIPLPRGEPDSDALASSPIEPSLDSSSSRRSRLTSFSVPSFSSNSYFEYKQPMTIGPHLRNTVIAAVTPPERKAKILHAISPFEGAALAKVHSIIVESKNRVCVEGMSFDFLSDLRMPDESVPRVPTPC